MLALFLSSLSASRTDYLLSYSWKFALEDQPTPKNCSASTFPVDLTDKQCDGLKQQLQVADEESCREMCCADDACSVWQWCEPGHDCAPANSCWTGDGIDMSACTNAQSGWASTGRTTTPGPSPQPQPGDACPNNSWCSVTYDDTKWRGVTLPHDFVVEGTFSESADKSHGYLPLTIGRYRKAFELPAGAESMHVRLDFEGSMSQTSVWLNGVCLGGGIISRTPSRCPPARLSLPASRRRTTACEARAFTAEPARARPSPLGRPPLGLHPLWLCPLCRQRDGLRKLGRDQRARGARRLGLD